MKRILVFLATFMCLLWILAPFVKGQFQEEPKVSETKAENKKKLKPENASSHAHTPVPEQKVTAATIGAVGDILIHDRVYKPARKSNGSYDFNPMFRFVKPYLGKTDITVANQETMIGGKEIGLSSYPSFNSPVEVGDALKENGVDLVTIANNHTLDRGEKAILNALNHWNSIGMPYTGAYQSSEDQKIIRILKRNDITFSFLSYTYGTNGIPVPEGKPHLVNLIDTTRIQAEVKEAEKVSDVVVVSLHFGKEYERLPNDEQEQLAQTTANAGADIIIGHHPHVLQPVSWLTKPNGERAFVAYSLGNFLSGQQGDYKDIGGIMQIGVKKIQTGDDVKIELQNPKFLPTWVNRPYEIIPMKALSDQSDKYNEIQKHMNQFMPELSFDF
ncbi:CapA family protein [Bacillus sp. B4EP4a]|uniref:CapA family protein n=1 Tax=Bacillus sp. B4EP4a TaxID=2590665 RepID=UPI00115184B0|nr:CapA family protein [Bacillus sp. B4EP4a]